MLGELEAGFEGAEKAVRVRERQKRKGKVVTEGDETGGMVGKRAGYLRWRLGPGAFLYVSFENCSEGWRVLTMTGHSPSSRPTGSLLTSG
jgi:hypothetical protein